jgi:hypothetical protein
MIDRARKANELEDTLLSEALRKQLNMFDLELKPSRYKLT